MSIPKKCLVFKLLALKDTMVLPPVQLSTGNERVKRNIFQKK